MVKMAATTSGKNKDEVPIPRGRFKSGRIWKTPKERFGSIKKTRGIKQSNAFDKQMKKKIELDRIKNISKLRENEHKESIEEKKQRRRDNLERQKEKELKSEVVQVIKNPTKIRRMKKKQLRAIAKRDTVK